MQHFSSIATATGTQIWPYHYKIKGHPSLINLINLVEIESPMLYTKSQPQSFLRTGEEYFKCYYYIKAILFNGAKLFQQIVNIPFTEASMWNLVITGKAVSEKTFKYFMILYPFIAQWQGQITPGRGANF